MRMAKLSVTKSIRHQDGKALSRLDFVMARYLALIASLPNDDAKPEPYQRQDERPTLSKWVR